MCGRATLKTPGEEIAEEFGVLVEEIGELAPRYNIAPTDEVLAVVRDRERGRRRARRLRWGLVPSWAKDATGAAKRINARAETVFETAMYRDAARHRRCLVVVDGFYEWIRKGDSKKPFYIRRADGRPFALAGVFDRWRDPDGAPPLDSCSVITTPSNELVRPIHDRMPAILAREDYDRWLDPGVTDRTELANLLRPFAAAPLLVYPVSTRVNSVRNDDPACAERVSGAEARDEAPEPRPRRQGTLFDP
jgi:putative SOS response-associated peptidase YedK